MSAGRRPRGEGVLHVQERADELVVELPPGLAKPKAKPKAKLAGAPRLSRGRSPRQGRGRIRRSDLRRLRQRHGSTKGRELGPGIARGRATVPFARVSVPNPRRPVRLRRRPVRRGHQAGLGSGRLPDHSLCRRQMRVLVQLRARRLAMRLVTRRAMRRMTRCVIGTMKPRKTIRRKRTLRTPGHHPPHPAHWDRSGHWRVPPGPRPDWRSRRNPDPPRSMKNPRVAGRG